MPGMATGEETVELLARVPMFRELSRRDLEELAQVAVPRTYGRGQVVFRQDDQGDTCYIVRNGSVRVTHDHTDGRTITLAELRPGDMFGELAMFDTERRSATVQALEETSALALLAGDMRRMLLTHPHIAVNMLTWLAERLRNANERIARQSFQTVASRVAGALLGQVEARREDGATDLPREIVIRATQSEIAQLAGASRESASRFLARLERDGVVTTGRGKVLVHEPASLRNYIY
ncbi:MAG: family transcriptional regulator, cyclic receptor protein [Thermoleophilaceae bacterium]|jgi:CRP/FNR family transcriptional regulator|nr:family transcriptional regulator, cyclic receptor protein [Thermoleophilaceae bacterium]